MNGAVSLYCFGFNTIMGIIPAQLLLQTPERSIVFGRVFVAAIWRDVRLCAVIRFVVMAVTLAN
jgi:hypothetical protein